MMEAAVAHGYASITVKGHAAKRQAQRQARESGKKRSHDDWAAGLRRLSGQGPMPMPDDSPGLRSVESFREEIERLRAAEYEAARKH